MKRLLMVGAAIVITAAPVSAQEVPIEATPTCGGLEVTMWGTDGDDNIYGTAARDVIHGLGGHDLIIGYPGDDVICGGEGSDDIYAHDGNDRAFGGPDNDSVEGGDGDDFLHLGGTGAFDPEWAVSLSSGNIACGDCGIPENTGNDTIVGGPGVDGCITSGPYKGGWWVSGDGGNDFIDLRGGDDCGTGDGGDDMMMGRTGDDKMDGGGGLNEMDGGRGVNRCFSVWRSVTCI